MIPKDRRNHDRRATRKAKGKDGGAELKKLQADATLDLTAADFELLGSDERGSSMKASLTPLRGRMVAWARRIAARLSELGIEVEATWSDEEPIAREEPISRGEQPRKTATASIVFHAPVRKNAILALRLRAKVVEVSVEIYPSVHARAVADEIARLFDALPDQFSLGKIEDEGRITTRAASANDVRALFEGEGGLWLGWPLPREVVLKHAALVGEQLGDAVIALSPVFALVTEITAQTRGPSLSAIAKPSPPRRAVAVEKGARVRVLSGPFVGKTGVVQELDGRGAAKVMLGLLATQLDVRDLAISKEGTQRRPILSSSHRKLVSGRGRER